MNTTILQIPVQKSLRNQAAAVAEKMGFSSLQEIIRLILTKLANKELTINIGEAPVQLSSKNDKRYTKMLDDIKKGLNTKSFSSVEDLMKDLNS